MDQSIPHEDILHYRRALTESSGIQLLEEEKEEPSRAMKAPLSQPITLL
jgi:hypothetical protein